MAGARACDVAYTLSLSTSRWWPRGVSFFMRSKSGGPPLGSRRRPARPVASCQTGGTSCAVGQQRRATHGAGRGGAVMAGAGAYTGCGG